jgi:beta-galactofuranoside beta-1,5-galactofuranosyltransferase
MDDDSNAARDPFLDPKEEGDFTGHSWSQSQSDNFPYVVNFQGRLGDLRIRLGDPRSRLRPLVQRARNTLSPYARIFRVIGVVLVFIIVFLCLPSTRPYTSDLVLKTTHLREGMMPANPRPLVHDHSPSTKASSVHEARPPPTSTHVMNCKPDLARLREIGRRHGLGDEVEYFKRYVRFTREPIERKSFTQLPDKFLDEDGFRTLQLSKSDEAGGNNKPTCGTPLEVAVPQSPYPADVDLSDFIFGVSTSFQRIEKASVVQEWAHWLTDGNGRPNGGRLLLQLVDASDAEMTDVARRLADAGIDAEVSGIDSRRTSKMGWRYLDLVPMLFRNDEAASRKWFVLCDDDTFFPAMNSLVARFRKLDHLRPLYVGTLSEDAAAVWSHGVQAFGGAGVFLSRPMAALINERHWSCRTWFQTLRAISSGVVQGDLLLRNCVLDNSEVRLTQVNELWQLDASGDVSGFYEAGLLPMSVHHYRGEKLWHLAYPLNTTRIALTCGEACPWQRFATMDDFVLSNGYSIAQYPGGVTFDLNQAERTFISIQGDEGWNFDYRLGPQRPPLSGTGRKVAWELRDAGRDEDGSVWQVYVRKRGDKRWRTKGGKPMKALDGIIELVWVPA